MANEDGTVTVGIDRPDYYNQCWFTDGYFDFVPHFLDGLAALPDLAPSDLDHLLSSTSIVQDVHYQALSIRYHTFDDQAEETLRITFQPAAVTAGGVDLPATSGPPVGSGWFFDNASRVLKVAHPSPDVEIRGR